MMLLDRRRALCHAGGAATTAVLCAVLYMLLDRAVPIDVIAGQIAPDPAPAGADVVIELKVIMHRECGGTIRRRIVDSAGVQFEYDDKKVSFPLAGPSEEPQVFLRPLRLPVAIHRGPAKYVPVFEWWCNPLQRIWPTVYVQRPVVFDVN